MFFRCTAQKNKFSIKDFFSKCDQIRRWIWSHLLKKSLIENLIFRAVLVFGSAKLLWMTWPCLKKFRKIYHSHTMHKKCKILHFPTDLITFTEEILNGKLYFFAVTSMALFKTSLYTADDILDLILTTKYEYNYQRWQFSRPI